MALTTQAESAVGEWFSAGPAEREFIERHVAIMQGMHWHYHTLTPGRLLAGMVRRSGKLHYFRAHQGDLEISMYYQFSGRRSTYYLWSVGLQGTRPVAEALDIAVLRFQEFLRDDSLSEVFAIRPRVMDNSSIQAFHNLVPEHPGLRVTVVEEAADSLLWRIEPSGVVWKRSQLA